MRFAMDSMLEGLSGPVNVVMFRMLQAAAAAVRVCARVGGSRRLVSVRSGTGSGKAKEARCASAVLFAAIVQPS